LNIEGKGQDLTIVIMSDHNLASVRPPREAPNRRSMESPSSKQNPSSSAAGGLSILIVDDEPNIRKVLSVSLTADGHGVMAVSNSRDALATAARQPFDVAFVDVRLGTETGLDLIPGLLAESPWLRVVVITAYASIETAVEAMKRGAADYLPKPFTPPQVRLVVDRVARLRKLEQRVESLQGGAGGGGDAAAVDLSSRSPAMLRAIDLARQVAASDATVLIRGESGTGKGVLARAIHEWSNRADKPFAIVSCPALSPQLLESELFGHVKGAFTGAVRDNPGRIAATAGGTLFLDEIGDLPLALQPKLLRFVQDREYERVGDTVVRHADARLVTATNVDLTAAVRDGRFREDLLYRINVIQIDVPPLRERPEDIVALAERLLAHLNRGRQPLAGFTDEAIAALRAYSWPGNVRELRNAIERGVILCRGDRVGVEQLPANIGGSATGRGAAAAPAAVGDRVPLEALEEAHIRRILTTTASLDEAAEVLGIDTATLYRRRKKYRI
jgi:NtrC-family two-component system response regulator AlgB